MWSLSVETTCLNALELTGRDGQGAVSYITCCGDAVLRPRAPPLEMKAED
jgi:hypothetical protein